VRRPPRSVSEDLVTFWTSIAVGSATAVKQRYGFAPRLSAPLAGVAALADRLHGRPVLAEEVDDRPMAPAFTLPAGTPGVSVT